MDLWAANKEINNISLHSSQDHDKQEQSLNKLLDMQSVEDNEQ